MANQFFEIVEKPNGEQEMHCYPHRYQKASLECLAQETYNLKGWRGGYTSHVAFWMINEMVRCGPGNLAKAYLCVTPSLQVARGGLIPELERVFCNYLGYGKMYAAPRVRIEITDKGEQALWGHRQKEKTSLVFCYAADPDSFASYTGLAAATDECGQKGFKLESKFVLDARLSTALSQKSPIDGRPLGRQLHGSTVYTWGWVKQNYDEWIKKVYAMWRTLPPKEFHRRFWAGTLHPTFHFYRFDSNRNPMISKAVMETAKARLPRWLYEMRYRARFTRPAGMIFEDWNPARHVVDPFHLPSAWPRHCAIDFGRKNFHALFIAHDEERDRHFIYRSYHRIDLTNAEHARQILRVEDRLAWTVAGQISEEYDRAELAAGGLVSRAPAFKALWQGINNVAAAIKLDKVYVFRHTPDDGLPTGFVNGCPGFQEQVETYSRPIDEATGVVLLDKDPEDKESYHFIDPLRGYGTYQFNEIMTTPHIPVAGGREQLHSRGDMAAQPVRAPATATGGVVRGGRSRDAALRPTGLRFLP